MPANTQSEHDSQTGLLFTEISNLLLNLMTHLRVEDSKREERRGEIRRLVNKADALIDEAWTDFNHVRKDTAETIANNTE